MNLFHIPLFIKAETPEALVLEMIKKNNQDGVTYKYFAVLFDGKNYVAWYNGDASLLFKNQLNEMITEKVNNNARSKKNDKR